MFPVAYGKKHGFVLIQLVGILCLLRTTSLPSYARKPPRCDKPVMICFQTSGRFCAIRGAIMYDDRDTGKEWRGNWGTHVSMHVWGREGDEDGEYLYLCNIAHGVFSCGHKWFWHSFCSMIVSLFKCHAICTCNIISLIWMWYIRREYCAQAPQRRPL